MAYLNGAFGYYLMIILLAVVCILIVKPRIRTRWYVLGPFVAWLLVYFLYFRAPIIANECLPAQIPGNLGWEVLWQFAFLGFAFATFYPRVPLEAPETVASTRSIR